MVALTAVGVTVAEREGVALVAEALVAAEMGVEA